jgi:hypothetical protein
LIRATEIKFEAYPFWGLILGIGGLILVGSIIA